ncbi:hypothetical protein MFIFM68171_05462 [Madurella fahalii]|uniref:Protein kinase domain-containing protein n=1 Tax=Madurella fahalii TaxID=1157608 RepID=A0ABQ0GBY2_9PEZI
MPPTNSPSFQNYTILVHPLNNPEILKRQKLYLDKNHAPSLYLRKRSDGFIFIKELKQTDSVFVGLFATADDPHELVVIKKLWGLITYKQATSTRQAMAPEIELCSLADVLVKRRLPLGYTMPPFVQLHAFQVHNEGSQQAKYKDFDATLFYKYYNGGTLLNLIERHKKAGRRVPEGFIWHVIAQVGRALSHLHTGTWPSPVYNVMHKDEIGVKPDKKVNKSETLSGWKPIVHMDGHADNIWLHYPSDEEKAKDPPLEGFTDSLPQVVLGDFGLAFEAHNDPADWLFQEQKPGLPEPETLKDKADFGVNLKHLIGAASPDVNWDKLHATYYRQNETEDDWQALEVEKMHYSYNLGACVEKLETLIRMRESGDWWYALDATNERHWERFATNDFVYGTMISWADVFVSSYIGSNDEESVRWTQPSLTCMPYQCRTKKPSPYFRRTWTSVDRRLNVKSKILFGKGWAPGSVEICKATIVGGTVERELDPVPYTPDPSEAPEKPQPPVTKPQPSEPHVEHGIDSLPDYSDFESPSPGDQLAARRAAVQPSPGEEETPSPLPSPPLSPFQIQRMADRRMREQRCREKWLMEGDETR